MEKTIQALTQIKTNGSMTINNWTFKTKGRRFEISKSGSTETRVIPERALQRILNNIL